MNWKKPTIENHPPFKRPVIGLIFPKAESLSESNEIKKYQIEIVYLHCIDETGPVFYSFRSTLGSIDLLFADVFGGKVTTNTPIKIDLFADIVLPTAEELEKLKELI